MKFLHWLKNKRKAISLSCLACLALLLLCLLAPALFGYPQWVGTSLAKGLTPKCGTCQVGQIRGSLLTGFYIDDLMIQRPTSAGMLLVYIPELKVDVHLAPLLYGKIFPKELIVDNASVNLELYDENNEILDATAVESIDITAKISSSGKLSAQINAEFLGVLFDCEAHLTDADQWQFSNLKKIGDNSEAIDGEGFISEGTEKNDAENQAGPLPQYDYALMATIHEILNEIRTITSPASSAYAIGDLLGSMTTPEKITLTGNVGIADTAIYERPILKAYGKYTITMKEALFPELHIVFNALEQLAGSARVNLEDQTVEGQFHANLMPENLLRLIDAPVSLLPRYFSFATPITFDGELPKSNWKLATISPVMSFDCEDLLIENLPIKRAAGKFTYNEKCVLLENLLVEVDSAQKNVLNGEVKLMLPEKILQGKLEGNANLGEILHELTLIPKDTPLESLDDVTLTATLNPSPLQDWHLWDTTLSLQQKHALIANFPLDDFQAELTLKDKKLALKANAGLNGKKTDSFSLKAYGDLPETFTENPISISFHTNALVDGKNAVDANASFIWEKKDFRIDNGTAIVRPELLGGIMEKPLNLDEDSPIHFFQCMNPEKPAMAKFNVPPVKASECWSLEAQVSMPEMRFLNTEFAILEGSLTLTEDDIVLRDVKGESLDHKDRASCELKVHFDPLRLQFSDVDVYGKPTLISNIVYADEAIEIYNRIWEDFTWTDDSQTHLHASEIEYREFTSDEWTFHLRGTAETQNFLYNGMELRKLDTDLTIELPEGQVTFENVRISDMESTEGDVLVGNASLQIDDVVGGTFHLEKRGGRLKTLELLLHVFSSIEEHIRPFDLAPEANFSCDGRFQQDNFLTLALKGTIESPYLKYRNFVIHNFKGTWEASDRHFSWNLPEAEFYEGTLTSTGYYSFGYQEGEILARAEGLPLAKLVQMVRKNPENATKTIPKETPGKLGISGHFTFLTNWANKPFHLEGKGEAHITEADLWRFPTFHTLGIILANGSFQFFSKDKIAALGQITKLDTHFECQGTTIHFKNVKTDGSIIALKGAGEYDINANSMDFLFSGELMKSVSLVSLALRPLAWAFDAKLTGQLDEPVWNLKTPLSRLFQNF